MRRVSDGGGEIHNASIIAGIAGIATGKGMTLECGALSAAFVLVRFSDAARLTMYHRAQTNGKTKAADKAPHSTRKTKAADKAPHSKEGGPPSLFAEIL